MNTENNKNVTLSIADPEQAVFGTISLMNRRGANETLSAIFSGSYQVNGHACYAQIIFNKTITGWESNLEINTSPLGIQQLDLESIRQKKFTKLSVFSQHLENFKTTHYFFYQSQVHHTIRGKFRDYRLKGSAEGWCLLLKHEKPDEETQVFLAETASEIVIGNIRYQLNPALASLFAVGTIDAAPIMMEDLIAPLSVETTFAETAISKENNVYKIANISVASSNKSINFGGQFIPFSYLKYVLETEQATLLRPKTVLHLNDQLSVAQKPMLLVSIGEQPTKSWIDQISGFLLGGVFVATTAISAGFFMVSKRFKRPQVNRIPLVAGAVPLLRNLDTAAAARIEENPTMSAKRCEERSLNIEFAKMKENVASIVAYDPHFSNESAPFPQQSLGVNEQLVLANYLLRHFHHAKAGKKTLKKISKEKNHMARKLTGPLFFIETVSKQPQPENEMLIARPNALLT